MFTINFLVSYQSQKRSIHRAGGPAARDDVHELRGQHHFVRPLCVYVEGKFHLVDVGWFGRAIGDIDIGQQYGARMLCAMALSSVKGERIELVIRQFRALHVVSRMLISLLAHSRQSSATILGVSINFLWTIGFDRLSLSTAYGRIVSSP